MMVINWADISMRRYRSGRYSVKNDTGQRNLGSLAYNMKCKWENEAKKAQLRLRGEGRMRFREV
jgi:hypothetical protein